MLYIKFVDAFALGTWVSSIYTPLLKEFQHEIWHLSYIPVHAVRRKRIK